MTARRGGPDAAVTALEVALNWRVLGVTVLLTVVTTLLFGIVPAWRASATSPGVVANTGRVAESHGRLASSLIVAQVSLSLLLVIGAGLFTRTLYNLRTVDRGFSPGNVLLATSIPGAPACRRRNYRPSISRCCAASKRFPVLARHRSPQSRRCRAAG